MGIPGGSADLHGERAFRSSGNPYRGYREQGKREGAVNGGFGPRRAVSGVTFRRARN